MTATWRSGAGVGGGPNQPEYDRQQKQPVEQTKDDHQEEDLEEGGEHVRVAGGEKDEGDKGGDAAVEDGGADVHQGGGGSLPPAAGHREEGVADMGWIVDTQTWNTQN